MAAKPAGGVVKHLRVALVAVALALLLPAATAARAEPAAPVPARPEAAADPQKALAALAAPPQALAAKPPPTRACPPDDPNCFTPAAGRTLGNFLRWTSADVDRLWRTRLSTAGRQWVSPRVVQIGGAAVARSKCVGGPVGAHSPTGPFYCAADGRGAVYLPLGWLKRAVFPRSEFRKEDFALAYIVAHEWGHHLQRVLGILEKSKLTSIQIELQADCLAGVWAYSTWSRRLLEPGDIEKAIRLARRIGDAPGTPANDPYAHGSPAQRAGWFNRGYNTGNPAKCRTY